MVLHLCSPIWDFDGVCGSHRASFGSHWSSNHVETPDYLNWNFSILKLLSPMILCLNSLKKKSKGTQIFAIQFSLLVLGQASALTASVYVLTMDGNMVCGVPRGSMTLSSLLLPDEPRRICRQNEPNFCSSLHDSCVNMGMLAETQFLNILIEILIPISIIS